MSTAGRKTPADRSDRRCPDQMARSCRLLLTCDSGDPAMLLRASTSGDGPRASAGFRLECLTCQPERGK